MFEVAGDITWARAGAALALLAIGGFLVSWLATDRLALGRAPYIGVLALATASMGAVALWLVDAWSVDLLAHHWRSGLVGALVTGAVVGYGIRKTPATHPRSGRELREAEAWEGLVYGVSEGLLLSALPALVAWQAAVDSGWGAVPSWLSALGASAAVIALHHFGYWDYRGPLVLEVVAGCLILTVGFLVTGSVLAPVIGHVVMHIAGVTKGVELPPHRRPHGQLA